MKNIDEFLSESEPHSVLNGHPPTNPNERYDWESKLLFSVYNKLNNECNLLDYGCGVKGTLQLSLFKRFPEAKYYGLDVHNFKNDNSKNIKLGHISELNDVINKVDCMVAGSIFSHLDWKGIEGVLDKIKPLFDNGGEFGFTTIISDEYKLIKPNHYGPNTYGMSIMTENLYLEYCEKNNLILELLPFTYPLINSPYKEQKFYNIKIND